MVAPPAQADEVYAKWLGWLDRLTGEVVELHHHWDIWKAMNEALGSREESETFHEHYAACYVAAAASAVRRLTDSGSNGKSITLARLVNDIEKQRAVMTKERYVELFDETVAESIRASAPHEFERLWGDADGRVRLSVLEDLRSMLTDAEDRVAPWVDRTVAHIDQRGPNSNPTYGDLDTAIEGIGKVLQRCRLLLKAENWVSVVPTPQDDWRRPFRQALFAD